MGLPVNVTKRILIMMGVCWSFKSITSLNIILLLSFKLMAQEDILPFKQFERLTSEDGLS
jgi:hypothetical protein